jgi:hypothetical protein
MDKALLRRRVLRFNVLLGVLVFAVAVAFSITGEYSSLAERTEAESLFNFIALLGVGYAAFSWIFCVMSKPFWFPLTNKGNNQ